MRPASRRDNTALEPRSKRAYHKPLSMRRTMAREIGTAFAVLAIYLLTILAPLHQARASQLAFAELGYAATQSGWLLCTPVQSPGDDNDLTVSKCPAAGTGKHEVLAP